MKKPGKLHIQKFYRWGPWRILIEDKTFCGLKPYDTWHVAPKTIWTLKGTIAKTNPNMCKTCVSLMLTGKPN